MATTRGQIVSPERARQIKDFSGLLFGTITPTDIDGLIEYHDKAYVIIEVKLEGTAIPDGQELALMRLADDLRHTGKSAIFILAEHYVWDVDDPIDVANAIVIKYRMGRRWHTPPPPPRTVKCLITQFLDRVDGRNNHSPATHRPGGEKTPNDF